jgi:DNA invertase Pin-like site-specific DNA recombinase
MSAARKGGGMREGITVEISAVDRGRLEAIVADWNSPQKHVWRARIVLLTADGLGTNEIMRQVGTSKVTVWRWQERFMGSGSTRCCTTRRASPAKRRCPSRSSRNWSSAR